VESRLLQRPVRHVAARSSLAGAAAVACAWIIAACSEEAPAPAGDQPADPGALVLHGKNVTLYYHPDAVPCAGTLAYLDANVDALGRYLAQPISPPIPYHYRQDIPCPADAVGCAVGAPGQPVSLWSTTPDSVHELVHAVQMPQALSASFLMEAQAVALGEPDFDEGPAGLTDDDLLRPPALPGVDYPVAGDFGSYLLTRFGPAPFERLLAAVPRGASPDQVEAAFASTYGETMAQLRADRASAGQAFVEFPFNRVGFSECLALLPDDGVAAGRTATESLDCATNGVGAEGRWMNRSVPFDVAADGLYAVDVTPPAEPRAIMFLTGCGRTSSVSFGLDAIVPPQSFVLTYAPAGRYTLELGAPSQRPVSFAIAIRPIVVATDPGCATIPVVDVPADARHLVVLSMDDAALDVPFRLAAPAMAVPWEGAVGHAEICDGGCDRECPHEAAAGLTQLDAGRTYRLRAWVAPPNGFVAFDLD
jgi:hypothetical protein